MSDKQEVQTLIDTLDRLHEKYSRHEKASYRSRITPLLEKARRDLMRVLPVFVDNKGAEQGSLYVRGIAPDTIIVDEYVIPDESDDSEE